MSKCRGGSRVDLSAVQNLLNQHASMLRLVLVAAAVVIAAAAVVIAAAFALWPDDDEPLALGVATGDLTALDEFRQHTGVRPRIYVWYQAWDGSPPFDAGQATAASAQGALPMLTWEPWAPGAGNEQPRYALERIVAGDHDAYITAFARQVRAWDRPLAMRFAHELNASHYPWSVGRNGNTAEEARAAWAHVRGIFDREQAHKVVWVWSVNVHGADTASYATLFPGDELVDWVALDGYNGGDVLPWGGWQSPADIFGDSAQDLRELSDRPLAITEVASAEEGGDKAAWIRQLFAFAQSADVRALVWFDEDKEADWRIASSPAASAAFRREAEKASLGPPPLPERIEH